MPLRQQKVRQMIHGEHRFDAVDCHCSFGIDHPCVVDERIHPWIALAEFLGQTTNFRLRGEIGQGNVDRSVARGRTCRALCGLSTFSITAYQDHMSATRSQSLGEGLSNASTGTSDDTRLTMHGDAPYVMFRQFHAALSAGRRAGGLCVRGRSWQCDQLPDAQYRDP